MIRILASLALLFPFVLPFNYNNGASAACIVTKNLLFSHGNLIRQLKKDEVDSFKKYKKELHVFNTKINEAFDKAEENEAKNSTVPPMPIRPTLPSFCTGADTTMYIFGACTVQNNKVYIGTVLARELEEKEKGKLADFAKKLAAVTPGTTPPTDIYKGLEFCTEL
ncbi:Pepsin inhibitor-3-like repeated domain-containing protein [Caenorhabditis elegans]|uniref:Pepsin inhibitor-3-like repeated domain-containing protein n=1 Tax=Caenorhabditis elegans TaxID=6239 RepID=Q21619_CAEEL|nr:Pepsin inhibitor-3-like repeated domain-containing protein [Caenorhabditis elegans]CAA92188.2 Pepsin inhibitor-3-like repeated domain-containing protein [Caenorhabditis elegans]|eukprot:NP_510268.2 Uncharacterized protein CELE_R01E6.2 [Caenorhabditis elegans]